MKNKAPKIQQVKKGKFIAFEGIDGSGKSTQIRLLANKLKEIGVYCYTTMEPTDSPIGSLIHQIMTGRIKTDNKVVSDICKYTGLSEDSVEKLHGKLKNDSALNVIHDFVNSFLSSRYLESFESVSFWNFALNVLSRRPPQRDATLEEYVKRRNKREQDIIDALYNGKSVGEYIEMDIGTAIHSYATRAKAYLELIYDETEYTKYIRPQYVKEEEL